VKKLLLLLFAVLAAVPFSAHAQTAVYAQFSASDFHKPNIGWQYGPTFGLYYDHWGVPFLRAGVDLRASFLGSGSTVEDVGLIGPRVQLHPHVVPLMPYAEVLGGVAHVQIGQGSAQINGNEFAYQALAGLDLTIFPRLDWRVAEYSWGGVQSLNQSFNPTTISTGLVLRLP